MHTEQIVVVGAGGHSKVVLDALLRLGVLPANIRVTDSSPDLVGRYLLGVLVEGQTDGLELGSKQFHVAIGNGVVRQRIQDRLEALGGTPQTIIHSAAVVSLFAKIDRGCFVAAGAIVGPSANLRKGVIVNHAAVVDHDCVVGEFSHIAPGAILGGAVTIGARVLIGAGAVVLPGVIVGDGAIVGAGAVVTHNVPHGICVAGVPARILARGRRD